MRLLFCTLLVALAVTTSAEVIRPAPEFSWPGAGNPTRSLRSLRGQPVVLVIADSPKTKAFRKQVKWLEESYTELASKGAVFIAAFRNGQGPVKSDIPFVVANNGAAVASGYGANGDFALAIIGRDGNLDYVTDKVRPGQRVRDVIINNYSVQASTRK
jgi:hypothetical protein